MISPTVILKLTGVVLTLVCFGIASDDAFAVTWLGSIGVILIFLANFASSVVVGSARAAIHVIIATGLLLAAFALFNVGTWWGWLGLVLLFTVFERDGETI